MFNVRDLFPPSTQAEFDALSPKEQEEIQTEFDEQSSQMLKPIGLVLAGAVSVLELVAKSGMIAGVAKLQREYYLQLVETGFTPQEALALASHFTSLLSAVKQGGK